MFSSFELITISLIAVTHLASVPFNQKHHALSRWLLDFSSGLGLGYAFLYLLPKIGYMTSVLAIRSPEASVLVTNRLYMYLLAGFLVYYLVDFKKGAANRTPAGMVLNTASFVIYNALVGTTIVHLNHNNPVIYMVAATVFVLHLFGVNNYLISMYPERFDRWMKWAFVVAVFAGGVAGTYIEKGVHYTSVATALVGGIIIILSVRLKLPARARVNVKAFLAGILVASCTSAVYGLFGVY